VASGVLSRCTQDARRRRRVAGRKRQFGNVRRLPSKRWQAFYRHGTDVRHTAPSTFETKLDAEAWLVDERRLIASGAWLPPKTRHSRADEPVTLGEYAQAWVRDRQLKPRTREHYGKLLSSHLAPLAGQQLTQLTAAAVRRWHADLDSSTPTYSAHAYSLLRAILTTAADDGDIPANPCHIRGAGSSKRAKKINPATLDELEVITREMSPRYQPMILLAVWCALRFGEMIELRRRDVDLTVGVIRVRRGAARADGEVIIDTPKSAAGVRGGHPATPPSPAPRPPQRAGTRWQGQFAVPGSGRPFHPRALHVLRKGVHHCLPPWRHTRQSRSRFLWGAGDRWKAGPTSSRPTAHRGGSCRTSRRHARRTYGSTRPFDASGGTYLPTCRAGSRRAHCCNPLPNG
jgi:integrase